MSRTINNPQRPTEVNEEKTRARVEQYHGVVALLATWEQQPDEIQARNYAYIMKLHKKVRTVRNYLLHRADAKAHV